MMQDKIHHQELEEVLGEKEKALFMRGGECWPVLRGSGQPGINPRTLTINKKRAKLCKKLKLPTIQC